MSEAGMVAEMSEAGMESAIDGGDPGLSTTSTVWRSLSDPQSQRLIRGMPIFQLLRSCGRPLASSIGDASAYSSSQPTSRLAGFVSHSWRAGRWTKYLNLAIYYNFSTAVFHFGVVMVVCVVLQVTQVVPMVSCWSPSRQRYFPRGMCCQLLGAPCFVLSLLFGHWMRKTSALVFLDKTCIQQDDPDKKKAGIDALATFINVSDEFILLLSKDYLERLWTVYELVSFSMLHSVRRIRLLPEGLPAAVMGPCLTFHVFYVVDSSLQSQFVLNALPAEARSFSSLCTVGLLVCMCLVGVRVWRQWHRQQWQFERTLQNFSLDRAACFDEHDRPVLKRNVSIFAKCAGAVCAESPDEAAHLCIEELTKASLPKAMRALAGRAGLQYKCAWGAALPALSYGFDAACGFFVLRDWRMALVEIVVAIVLSFVIIPLAFFALTAALVRRCIYLGSCAEALFICSVGVVVSAATYGMYAAVVELHLFAEVAESAWWMLLTIGVDALLIALTIFVFRDSASTTPLQKT